MQRAVAVAAVGVLERRWPDAPETSDESDDERRRTPRLLLPPFEGGGSAVCVPDALRAAGETYDVHVLGRTASSRGVPFQRSAGEWLAASSSTRKRTTSSIPSLAARCIAVRLS